MGRHKAGPWFLALMLALVLPEAGCKRHGARRTRILDAGGMLELTELVPLEPSLDAGVLPALVPLEEREPLGPVELVRERTFTSLRDARLHRESVVKMNLDGQALAALPGLVLMTRLQWLSLANNNLTDVPAVGSLSRLQRLDLSDNPLKRPPDVGNLLELTDLDLSRTQLATLPFDIGRLQKLEVLRVGSVRIKRLPEALGQLGALKTLSLRGCTQLDSLPADLSGLRQLSHLDLAGTRIPPAEVARIQALLPHLNVVGAGLELQPEEGPETPVQVGAAEAHEAALQPCGAILQRGWRDFLAPLEQAAGEADGEGEVEASPVREAVERYRSCREEASRSEREGLDARTVLALEALDKALAGFASARFDLLALGGGKAVAAPAHARLDAQAARADALAEVTHRLMEVKTKSDFAPNLTRIRALLLQLSTAPSGSEGEDYAQAYVALQDGADDVFKILRPLPAPAADPALRYMRGLLEDRGL